ncbi:MAG: LLM class flavin-dependent oxidoreductase [bacterium]|nr:LLM class flavin-dependent oxidoreductase [bacterium]
MSTAGRPRFSFTRVPAGPIARFVDFARYGRDLGYDRLWVPDQTYHSDPFVVLAAVAAAAPGLELGMAVTNPYTRHPVQIARAAAAVAEVCGGRFLLGLGAGNRKHVLERLAIDGRHAASRVREAAVIIRQLIQGETVHHEGAWTLRGIRLEREGAVDVPIFIGTRNPRMLAVAGEVADGVMLESLVTAESQACGLERVRAGAGVAGRTLGGMEFVAWQSVLITDDRATGIEAMRAWVAYLLGMTTPEVAAWMGIRPDVIERLHGAFAKEGPEAATRFVGAEEVDRVVIVGNPDQVAERCAELVRGGTTDFTVQVWSDDAAGRDTLARFAREVRPRIIK